MKPEISMQQSDKTISSVLLDALDPTIRQKLLLSNGVANVHPIQEFVSFPMSLIDTKPIATPEATLINSTSPTPMTEHTNINNMQEDSRKGKITWVFLTLY
jgi:hypothetical protein